MIFNYHRLRLYLAGMLGCMGLMAFVAAEDVEFSAEKIQFFETSIRPVLADNCLECHTGTKAKQGLELHHRDGWLKGSDYRKIVDLSDPKKSVVVQAVSHAPVNGIRPMPEEGSKLSDEEISNLTRWIGMGLPWPEETSSEEFDAENHWSFRPVSAPEVPEDTHPIDFFIRSSQGKAGVTPSPRADRAILYRRVHFSLLGLPPRFEDQQAFVNDPRPDAEAWPELIRKLLESPHYGERWARHWMDVARYSDTKGYEAGGRERRFVYSYTYRDWLIRAFNDDLPYDQFLLYQLAAEQLVDWKSPEKQHLAAMGFLTLSKNGNTELIIDDRIDTTFRGMMALTVACARCHDHKIDPIPTSEYYGLYGIFSNSLETALPIIGEEKSGPKYEKYLADLEKRRKVVEDFLAPKLAKIAKENPELAGNRARLMTKLDRASRRELQNKQRVVDKFVADAGMEPDKAIVLKEKANPSSQSIFIRGNPARKGEAVDRKFLSIASENDPVIYPAGGRLALAKDIASAENYFTARNIVNRVWMWHFGEGIVRSVDDFGMLGEQPDHPELLDFLASWFVENGWSIKKLHELILTSETWRQDSRNEKTEANMLVDSENRLLWKFTRKRLDLEQLRDSVLAISGALDPKMHGHAVRILEPPYSNRRSVYAFIDRQNLNPIFRNFDFSNPQETTGKRPSTTIPMQALFTLNSKFVQDHAKRLSEKAKSAENGIEFLHHEIFAAEPAEEDRVLAESFLSAFDSETKRLGTRQTNTEWSYGWGSVDETTGKVSFTEFPHWTGNRWQIRKEHPLKDDPRGYLYADTGATHPGQTSNESAIYRWRAPEDIRVSIQGIVQRDAKGKGNGVRIRVISDRSGSHFDQVLGADRKQIPAVVREIALAKDESLYFLVDPHENEHSFDSVRWSPQVTDLAGRWPKWGLAESFSGPATPSTPWSAYAHALFNTNRFLFID